ncbi:extracellular solute-binding protein [Prochlorococcus sp. MIT 0603]|uniref:extracellular solute-binding protein n=1 Tax=Prochlorococcus sp. MIT 0603 TaxID=1499500 RepID=UPI0039A5E9A2
MKVSRSMISSLSACAVVIGASLGAQLTASTKREVRVYSGRHYNTDKQVFKQFDKETGIRVRLIETEGISLLERLKREGKKSTADVILLVDAARINNAAKDGLLQSFRSDKLEKNVPSNYKDSKRRWYALTRRVRVMVVNPSKVNASKIRTFADLADPSLKGLVCLRKRNSPYNQSLVANQIVLRGERKTRTWLNKMLSNVSQPYFPGDIGITRAVAQGKCGVGIVNHYYVARMLAGVNGSNDIRLAKKVRVITPNPAHVNVSAGGLARYAKNRSEAIEFLEYLATPKGSEGLAGPTYEHPLVGLNNSEEVKSFGGFKPDKVTISQLGEYNSKAIKMMIKAGWQ